MNDFKPITSFLIPHEPVSKKRSSIVKRDVYEILYTTCVEISHTLDNIYIGKT